MATQHPWVMQHERAVVAWVQQAGIPIRVTSRTRTWEQQNRLYCERRNSPVPAAPPGRSQHEFGYAYDVVPDQSKLASRYGASFRQGLTWVGQVAAAYGAVPIVEHDHLHVQVFPTAEWTAWLDAQGSINPVTGEWTPALWRQPQCSTAAPGLVIPLGPQSPVAGTPRTGTPVPGLPGAYWL